MRVRFRESGGGRYVEVDESECGPSIEWLVPSPGERMQVVIEDSEGEEVEIEGWAKRIDRRYIETLDEHKVRVDVTLGERGDSSEWSDNKHPVS